MKCRFCLIILMMGWLVGCGTQPDAAAIPSPLPPATFTPFPLPTVTALTLDLPISEPVSADTPEPTPTPVPAVPAPTLFDVQWEDRSVYAANLVPSEQAILSGLPGAPTYHMALTIDESLTRVSGRTEILYTNRTGLPLSHLYLRLFPNLVRGYSAVSNVLVNGQSAAANPELNNSALNITLKPPLLPGKQTVISFEFITSVPTTSEGNYGALSYQEGILALAHFYPVIPILNENGWNMPIPGAFGDLTANEASFYLVRLTAPANLTLVTTGVTTNQQNNGVTQTATIVAGPARDFYAIASERFAVVSGTVGNSTVYSYSPLEYQARAAEMLDYALYALELYGTMFGPYPYTEMDIASAIIEETGLEYPGIFVNSMNLYTPEQEYVSPDSYFLESTTVHETSHQWFYNVVGNDQVAESWLDEAMAQYLTYLYFLDRYGAADAQWFFDTFDRRWGRGSNYADVPMGLTTDQYPGLLYSAIIYGRGPLFLVTLQELMGPEQFTAFLQDYYRTYQWDVATTDGFKALAEAHCACDLSTLFETWVYPR